MQKIIFIIALVSLSLAVQSQDSLAVQKGSPATKDMPIKERDKIAKKLSPIEGKAIVYIIRLSAYGFVMDVKHYCDSVFLGTTMAKRYLYTVLNPGKYTFVSKKDEKEKLELAVEAGKIYYINVKVRSAPLIHYVTTELRLLSEEEGKKQLAQSRLSIDNTYNQ